MKKHLIIFMSLTLLINMVACSNSESQLLEETESKLESVQLERDDFKFQLDNINLKLKDAETTVGLLRTEVTELKTALEEAEKANVEEEDLIFTSQTVLKLIKDKNFEELASYVGSSGLRFSPYSNVEADNHIVIQASEFTDGTFDDDTRTWGTYDGSGDPISYGFNEYYNEFIYDQDFLAAPMIGNNSLIGSGNIINNIAEVYSNHEYVEYHFPGFEAEYEGMDWESLVLVFEKVGNEYKLVGIVHGQWTI